MKQNLTEYHKTIKNGKLVCLKEEIITVEYGDKNYIAGRRILLTLVEAAVVDGRSELDQRTPRQPGRLLLERLYHITRIG